MTCKMVVRKQSVFTNLELILIRELLQRELLDLDNSWLKGKATYRGVRIETIMPYVDTALSKVLMLVNEQIGDMQGLIPEQFRT